MDHRIALKSNTPLHLCNDRGEAIHCVIESEIGRGGSCIVYEAARITDTGDKTLYRVKEFYPYKLNISRDENNGLTPSANDAEVFAQKQEQFRSDFSVQISCFILIPIIPRWQISLMFSDRMVLPTFCQLILPRKHWQHINRKA